MDCRDTMMIRQNASRSFDDTGVRRVEAPVLDAVQALLSLAPARASTPPVRPHASPYPPHPPHPTYHQHHPPYQSYHCYQMPRVSPSPYHAHYDYADHDRVTAKNKTPQILNMPRLLPSSKAFGTVSSCESSLDGTLVSECTTATTTTNSTIPTTPAKADSTPYFEGCISLSLPQDEESLSLLHCFMRKHCVEAFSATAQDVSTPRYGKSHGRSIVVGQVGIQCTHCKHRPYATRQERAVCFPSSLKNIYHSIETWQRRHSLVCGDIPGWAKLAMTDLMGKSRSGAGGRRQYWEESAKQLGMVDTNSGIRFVRPPAYVAEEVLQTEQAMVCLPVEAQPPSKPLVCVEERGLVTNYLFTLLDQMETCYFSEQDRVGGRSKVKDCSIGYPGLQCKHCSGKAGFGRYFPVSIQALTSANSDRNIFNHITKCRRCPEDIKTRLSQFLSEQQTSKNRRGSRKLFFQGVWHRMHKTDC